MPTLPNSSDIASHIDPALRDYIDARIAEALRPIVHEISSTNAQVARIMATIDKIDGNVSALNHRLASRDEEIINLRGGRR